MLQDLFDFFDGKEVEDLQKKTEEVQRNAVTQVSVTTIPPSHVQGVLLFEALKQNSSVQKLDVSYKMSFEDVHVVCEALKVNKSITSVILAFQDLSVDVSHALADLFCTNCKIKTLHVKGMHIPVLDEFMRILSEALKVNQSICDISFAAFSIGSKYLFEALRESKTVENLDFASVSFTEDTFMHLTQMLRVNQSVKVLNLFSMDISGKESDELCESLKVNKRLQRLNMPFCTFSNNCFGGLGEMLKVNHCLQHLDFSANNVPDIAMTSLCGGLMHNSSLTHLNVFGSNMSPACAQILAQSLRLNHSLTLLDVSCCSLSAESIAVLASSIATNSKIRNLALLQNEVGHVGVKSLSEMLKVNSSLLSLDLSCNELDSQSVVVLSEGLALNSTLQTLNLRDNRISGVGMEHICKSLNINASNNLVAIDLRQNHMLRRDDGAEHIRNLLRHTKRLMSIRLDENEFQPEESRVILEGLLHNRSVSHFYFLNNEIDASCVDLLGRIFRENYVLTLLMLSPPHEHLDTLLDHLECNGSIVELSSKFGDKGHLICRRNKTMRHKTRQSCQALLSVRRHRKSSLNQLQKEVVGIIADFLWETRTDLVWE